MCERAKKTALVRPEVDEDEGEEGEAFVAEESRFFSGFLTWIMAVQLNLTPEMEVQGDPSPRRPGLG